MEENGKFISNAKEVARIFNQFFVNIVPNLGINTNHNFLTIAKKKEGEIFRGERGEKKIKKLN